MDLPHLKQIEEFLKFSRVAQKIDKERAEQFEAMTRTPGWQTFTALLTELVEVRGSLVLAPAGSVDGAIGLEHIKGTMSGLIMARDLPSITIAAMKTAGPAADGEE